MNLLEVLEATENFGTIENVFKISDIWTKLKLKKQLKVLGSVEIVSNHLIVRRS